MYVFTDIEDRNQAVGSAEGYSELKRSTKPGRVNRSIKRDRRAEKLSRNRPNRDPRFPYMDVQRSFPYIRPEFGGELGDDVFPDPSEQELIIVEAALQSMCRVSQRKLFLGETVVFDYLLFLRIQRMLKAQGIIQAQSCDEPMKMRLSQFCSHTETIIKLLLQLPACFDRDVFYQALSMLDLNLRLTLKNIHDEGVSVGFEEYERLLGLDRLVHAGTVGWGLALDSHGGNLIYQNLHKQMWMEFEAVRNPGGEVKEQTNTLSSFPAVKPDVGTQVGEVGKDGCV